MRKSRCLDFASVRSAATVANEIDGKFSLWRLDRGKCGSRWHLESLRVQLEVMYQRFHAGFHLLPPRWYDFRIVDPYFALWHLVQALVNDSQRLTHFLHAAQVSKNEKRNGQRSTIRRYKGKGKKQKGLPRPAILVLFYCHSLITDRNNLRLRRLERQTRPNRTRRKAVPSSNPTLFRNPSTLRR